MKRIELSQGYVALVDDEDYAELNTGRAWSILRSGDVIYARRTVGVDQGKYVHEMMHRRLMNPSAGMKIDHIDGNGLNNQKSNLRFATHSQNLANCRSRKDNTSGFRGISRKGNKWLTKIGVQKTQIHLGLFNTKEEAAKAYDAAAKKYFGEFARLNFG